MTMLAWDGKKYGWIVPPEEIPPLVAEKAPVVEGYNGEQFYNWHNALYSMTTRKRHVIPDLELSKAPSASEIATMDIAKLRERMHDDAWRILYSEMLKEADPKIAEFAINHVGGKAPTKPLMAREKVGQGFKIGFIEEDRPDEDGSISNT